MLNGINESQKLCGCLWVVEEQGEAICKASEFSMQDIAFAVVMWAVEEEAPDRLLGVGAIGG